MRKLLMAGAAMFGASAAMMGMASAQTNPVAGLAAGQNAMPVNPLGRDRDDAGSRRVVYVWRQQLHARHDEEGRGREPDARHDGGTSRRARVR